MIARALVVSAAAALVALTSGDALACDCSTPTREKEYAQAARVVVVRVDPGSAAAHTERDGRPRKATLPVERSFKGGSEPSVEVKLSAGKDCIYFPAEPGRHVVYLHARHEGGPLEASVCGHNGLVASSPGVEELAALEAAERDAESAPPVSSAPPTPAAASGAKPAAAPNAPTRPSRGCAGCSTAFPPAGDHLALALGVGVLVTVSRRRRAR